MTASTGTVLRPAEDGDASALAQLTANVSASGELEMLLTSAAIASAGGLSLVAERGGKIIGHVIVERREDNLGEVGIHIHETARGQGVGKALLEHAIAWSVTSGLAELYLSVSSANAGAAALYSSLGFHEDGVEGNTVTMKLPLT
jgi:ribosomal protein S18 acetylase RimI-like enzyme